MRARRRFQQGHYEGQREVARLQEVRWHQDQSNGHAHNQHGQTATSSTRTTPLVNAGGQPPPCQRVQGREKEVGKGVPLEDPPPKVEDVVPVVGEEEGVGEGEPVQHQAGQRQDKHAREQPPPRPCPRPQPPSEALYRAALVALCRLPHPGDQEEGPVDTGGKEEKVGELSHVEGGDVVAGVPEHDPAPVPG